MLNTAEDCEISAKTCHLIKYLMWIWQVASGGFTELTHKHLKISESLQIN